MSKSFRTKYLFQKYLNNNCTVTEIEELFELLKLTDNLKAIEPDLATLWNKPVINVLNSHKEDYQKFKYKIDETIKSYNYTKAKTVNYKWLIAASIIVCILLFIAHYYQGKYANSTNKIANNLIPVKNNLGVRKVLLSDGSIVFLNKESYLNYPSKFTSENRTVYLTGEAYFDVKHDAKRPFLIYTGKLVTKVLGTAFNIKTQNSDDLIEVTVARGKVAVSDNKKTLAILLPNQRISYNEKSKTYQKNNVNAHLSTLWLAEDIELNNITLKQAIAVIENHYKVKIKLANTKIMDCRFTAYFLNTTNLNQVIDVISRLNYLKYTIDNNGVYTLSGNGCN